MTEHTLKDPMASQQALDELIAKYAVEAAYQIRAGLGIGIAAPAQIRSAERDKTARVPRDRRCVGGSRSG
jgi:hypothetical protein